MKRSDYTKIGGFPFTQDNLKWQQDGRTELLKAICQMGVPAGYTQPVIISGVYLSAGPAAYSSGWIYLNGDIIYFAGGNIPAAPDNSKVYVQEYNTVLVYEDGNSENAQVDNAFVYGVAPIGYTQYEIATMKRFHEEFGVKAAEDDFTHVSIVNMAIGLAASPALANGDLYYKKIHTPKMLHLRFQVTLTNADRITAVWRYDDIATLPAGYRPSSAVHFQAAVSLNGSSQ